MRILIADDSVLLREGLTLIVHDEGHEVVASVEDGEAMVRACLELRPDLTISDIRMPPSHRDEGLRAALDIRRRWPQAPILLLSQYIVMGYASDLLGNDEGGIGYLLKDRVSDLDTFFAAIARVAAGGTVMDPEVVAQLVGRGRSVDQLSILTAREREVLESMAEGYSNAAIAERFFISEGAVEKNIQRIFMKMTCMSIRRPIVVCELS